MVKSFEHINGMVNVRIEAYDVCKYKATPAELASPRIGYFRDILSWDIVSGGPEAEAIEADGDGSYVDDYHEYLVLKFKNGDTATFRNSYVDMFRVN